MARDVLLLVALILACWRLSVMLVLEVGPFEVFEWVRHKVRHTMLGDLLTCTHCVSVWVSALLLLIVQYPVGHWVVYWLALSQTMIVCEKVMDGIFTPPSP